MYQVLSVHLFWYSRLKKRFCNEKSPKKAMNGPLEPVLFSIFKTIMNGISQDMLKLFSNLGLRTLWHNFSFIQALSGQVFHASYYGRTKSRTLDFVDIQFPKLGYAKELSVYENLNPGSVIGIWTFHNNDWHRLWQGQYKVTRNPTIDLSFQ